MKKRFMTSALGIPILLLFLLGHPWLTYAFIIIASMIAAYEYLRLTDHYTRQQQSLFILSLVILLSLPFVVAHLTLLGWLIAITIGVLLLFWVGIIPMWALGVIYIGIPLTAIIDLRSEANGIEWMLIFLLATWMTDSAALFGGRAFGKTQLTSISPNKTREGTASGVVAGGVGVLLWGMVLGLWADHATTLLLAMLILPPLAVIGDLLESKIKRTYSKKDSGTLFPGHGGMLDRIDSLLLTGPTMWLLVILTV